MPNQNEQCKLVILETSDIHGNIFPINYGNNEETLSGLAKMSSLLKRELHLSNFKLLIDNGDVIQGTPLTYHYARYLHKKKNPIISCLNHMKYDAAIIGNHEFNYGKGLLDKAVSESNFPWICANILDSTSKQPAFGRPYIIKEFENGLRVAVIGVTTHYIPNWENPNHIRGLEFADAFATTKKWVEILQKEEQYDLLVVSYHGGFERDFGSGEPTELLTGENQGYRMCEEIEGIDVLLTGHQHRKLAAEVNGVTIVQPGFNGQALARVAVSFQYVSGNWFVSDKSAKIIEINDEIDVDDAILNLANEYEVETQNWLDQTIGEIIGDMTIRTPLEVRMADHPLIEFINKVQMDAAGVDISNTALFHNGSPGFPASVTMRDIVSNYIYPNTLSVIRISGQDIKDALEKCASYFILDENRRVRVNPDFEKPKPQHYNYDMWEGIEYVLDITKPFGSRVVKLDYKGKRLNLNGEYDVVMNNYRAGGGGNFDMFTGKPVIKEIQTDMTELLAEFFQKHRTIYASCNKNWRVIY